MTDYSPAVRAEIERGKRETEEARRAGLCLKCRKAKAEPGYDDYPMCGKCLDKISQ